MKENLSETSETNLARSETSVLGNVHGDIQTDFSFRYNISSCSEVCNTAGPNAFYCLYSETRCPYTADGKNDN